MSTFTTGLLDQACLIVHGPDQVGLVAAISGLLTANKANIVSLDQYTDNPEGGAFFQRVVFERSGLTAALPELRAELEARRSHIADLLDEVRQA